MLVLINYLGWVAVDWCPVPDITLCPLMKDKILVGMGPHDKGIKVTNDGAEILKSIGVDLPSAKVLVGM